MSDEDVSPIVCASYTHARRYPMVLGKVMGWAPPVQLTIPQVAVFIGSLVVLVKTWGVWAPVVGEGFAAMVVAAVPPGAAWAVRRARVEGRSIVRTGIGWLSLLAMPRTGVVQGRPYRPQKATWRGARMFVASDAGAVR